MILSFVPLSPLAAKWFLRWDVTRSLFSPWTEAFAVILAFAGGLYALGNFGPYKSTIEERKRALKWRWAWLLASALMLLFWWGGIFLPIDFGSDYVAFALLLYVFVAGVYISFWISLVQLCCLYYLLRRSRA